MRRRRLALGVTGLLVGAYGVFQLLTQNSMVDLMYLLIWLVAVVAVHDGVVSPFVLAIGRALTRVPPLARRHLQLALVAGGMLTVVAVPLILRQGTQPPSKALLVHDYVPRLGLLLALVALVSLAGFFVQRGRSGRSSHDTES